MYFKFHLYFCSHLCYFTQAPVISDSLPLCHCLHCCLFLSSRLTASCPCDKASFSGTSSIKSSLTCRHIQSLPSLCSQSPFRFLCHGIHTILSGCSELSVSSAHVGTPWALGSCLDTRQVVPAAWPFIHWLIHLFIFETWPFSKCLANRWIAVVVSQLLHACCAPATLQSFEDTKRSRPSLLFLRNSAEELRRLNKW